MQFQEEVLKRAQEQQLLSEFSSGGKTVNRLKSQSWVRSTGMQERHKKSDNRYVLKLDGKAWQCQRL